MGEPNSDLPLGFPARREAEERKLPSFRRQSVFEPVQKSEAEALQAARLDLPVLSVAELRRARMAKPPSRWARYGPEALLGLGLACLVAMSVWRLKGWRLAEMLVLLVLGCLLLIFSYIPGRPFWAPSPNQPSNHQA